MRVQWSREDEHGWDPKGPPTLVDITAGLDAQGNIVGWESELWVPKADITEWPRTLAATLAGIPQKDAINPGNIHRNLDPSYPFANQKAVAHRLDVDAVPAVVDPHARPHAEHVRQRGVHRRVCGRGRGRPHRVPPALSRRIRAGIAVLRAAANLAKWDTRPSPRREASGPDRARPRASPT